MTREEKLAYLQRKVEERRQRLRNSAPTLGLIRPGQVIRPVHNAPLERKVQSSPYTPIQHPRKTPITWAYGVTTVPERRETLLPRTLQSLKDAGFDKPRLFVDGDDDVQSWRREFDTEVTCRYPKILTYGNWVLGLAELYIRHPRSTYYAMFQDDFITYKNLRAYLEQTPYPQNGYLNLYTFPKNQVRIPDTYTGWWESNQRGLGAVALVFSEQAVITLLTHSDSIAHMVDRPRDSRRGWKAVDGGIVDSMRKAGYKEYVHSPSLVQHTGMRSSMKNAQHPLATSFRGEDFDSLSLIKEKM